MTACFVRPTTAEIYTSLSALFSTNVLGGAPIIPESNEYYLVGNDVAATELFYSLSAQQWEQTQDATACAEALIANNAPLGLVPYGATFTNGYIQVFGPASSSIPSNLQCQIGSNTYNLSLATNANPVTLDTGGQAILLMTSLVPGATVNSSTNTAIQSLGTISSVTATLTILPAGWTATVVPQGNFCGGNDPETPDEFRARVIARKQFQPIADFSYIEEQAKTWPCVTRVLMRNCGDCCNDGSLQLYAFADNSFSNGIMPPSALGGLNTFIFGSTPGLGLGKAPIGIFGSFFEVAPVVTNITFYNMTCVTPGQFAEIQTQIITLFATLTPGQSICAKWIDAIVMGVNPSCCNYTLVFSPTSSHATLDCNNDLVPLCDYLPTVGTINYTTANASS